MRYLLLVLLVAFVDATFVCPSRTDCSQCINGILCKWCPSEGCVSSLKKCANEITHWSDCTDKPVQEYDDNVARNNIYPLIGATKANTSSAEFQTCKSRVAQDTIHVTRINVTVNILKEYCTADVYVVPSRKQIITVIHGSTGLGQILHVGFELEVAPVPAPVPNMKGSVLHYFAGAFENLWKKGLKSTLQDTISQHPGFELWCTGHSLGGSVAAILAAQVSLHEMVPSDKIKLMAFGAPKTGTDTFNRELAELVPHRFRVVNQMDKISTLPRITFEHFKYEIWYPSGMQAGRQWITCLKAKDPACKSATSLIENEAEESDHVTYFGVSIDTWWQSGCQY